MRRASLILFGLAAGLFLIALPLSHVTRMDSSGCRGGTPCDPAIYLPFGDLALGLSIVAVAGVVVLVAVGVVATLKRVHAWDVEERSAGR